MKRATGYSDSVVTLLSALPYVAGLAAMLLNGWHSDRTGERRWHTAVPLFVGATGWRSRWPCSQTCGLILAQ